MASRHSPIYRFEVDWAGDGTYSHPASDVTHLLLNGNVKYGARTNIDEFRVKTASADGRVTIDNTNHEYDPDSPRLRVDENALRSKQACRLTMDGVLVWSGLVSPDRRSQPEGNQQLRWDLESIHETSLNARDAELTVGGAGTVARLAQIFTQRTGIRLNVASQQPTGPVLFTGSWLSFLDDFSRFAGGWVIEDHTGGFLFRRFSDTLQLPVVANLGLGYEPLDASSFTARAGHVRNYAKCRSYTWINVDATAPLATRTIRTVGGGGRHIVELVFKNTASRRATGWTRFDVLQGDAFATVESYDVADDQSSVAVTIDVQPFTEPVDITVSGYGTAQQRVEASDFELNITEFDTQDVYGRRPLEMPVWFPPSYDGVQTFTRPWLRNLSQPPDHLTAKYRGLQTTASQSNILANIRAGDAVDFVQVVDGRPVTIGCVVLMVEIMWGINTPSTHVFHSVRRRAVPPAPLGVRVSPIGDQSAQLLIDVPSPAGENIYSRYDQVSPNDVTWGTL